MKALLFTLIWLIISTSAQAESFSQCVDFKYENTSYIKVLSNELDKMNIHYLVSSGKLLCYKPSNNSVVSNIINKTFPRIIPGPGYAEFNNTKFAESFYKYLTDNNIKAKLNASNDSATVLWEQGNILLVQSAIEFSKIDMAKEVKQRASILESSSNK